MKKEQVKIYAPRIFIRNTSLALRLMKKRYFVQLEGFQVDDTKPKRNTGEILSQRFYCANEKQVIEAVNQLQKIVTNNEAVVINLVKEFNCYEDTHLDLTDDEILSECSSSAM